MRERLQSEINCSWCGVPAPDRESPYGPHSDLTGWFRCVYPFVHEASNLDFTDLCPRCGEVAAAALAEVKHHRTLERVAL